MKWINVNVEPLPKDGSYFLALWKGAFCLASWDDEINRFWLQMQPGVYTGDMKVDPEREAKFTHWCKLEYPEDY